MRIGPSIPYYVGMIGTYAEAREAVEREIALIWGDTRGTLHVAEQGFEDEAGYLVPWGCREWMVDGDPSYIILNNAATFVDRLTGFVQFTHVSAELDRILAMSEVTV